MGRPILEERYSVLDSARPAIRVDGRAPAADALQEITLELFRADDSAEIAGVLLEGALWRA